MSYRRPKKNTLRLPKVLHDELASLGKLSPQKTLNKHSRGNKHSGRKTHFRGRSSHSPKEDDSVGKRRQKSTKPSGPKTLFVDKDGGSPDEKIYIDEEDLKIAELEKKLGLDKRKTSKLGDDELDGLLEGIGASTRGTKRKNDFGAGETTKYRITESMDNTHSEDTSSESSDLESNSKESEFKGFEETSDNEVIESEPPTTQALPTGKYIPPAARNSQAASAKEDDQRLQKQVQGIFNRLSESNMSTILSEIETLYRSNPRANVTSTITNLLLTILSVQQSLLDTFVILHAGFVAALYRLIGVDFGAHLVQTLVERFEGAYKNNEKDCLNIVVFLSELYNFGVVGASLIYDLVRMFLETMHELDTELLLKIIQNSGQQLRQDDPSALKDIVVLMQSHIASQDPVSLSVRTKFMVETIINLKNNRAKAATSTSVVTSEATIRMKKFLGKMGEKSHRSGGEPLRVSLDDIRNVKERGKWWLVGASWKNDDSPLQLNNPSQQGEQDALLLLAKQQRMNTEIRRAIFIALMGSEDYIDASARILLLPLKKAQRNEIPRVLVHCCANERVYNPFYSLVAKRLCSPASTPQVARVLRMGLQFNLWAAFREWGENTDETNWDEEHDGLDDAGKLKKAINLAKLYGSLVADAALSLKVLGFINLQSMTKTFLEVFFTELILRSQGTEVNSRNAEPLLQCVYKLEDTAALAKGIDWYLRRRNIEKAELATGEAKTCIAWGVGILRKGIAEVLQEG